jgi:hypothetical protein
MRRGRHVGERDDWLVQESLDQPDATVSLEVAEADGFFALLRTIGWFFLGDDDTPSFKRTRIVHRFFDGRPDVVADYGGDYEAALVAWAQVTRREARP